MLSKFHTRKTENLNSVLMYWQVASNYE